MKMKFCTIAMSMMITCLFVSIANTQIDTTSYSVGVVLAKNLQKDGFTDLNSAVVAQAIQDVMNKADLKVDPKVSEQIFKNELKNIKLKATEMNKAAGEAFLAENAKKEGIITLPSGLQYEVLVQGDGASPSKTDKVKTHYHGTLIDGTVFDSSVERGQPISFPLGNVIVAWQEALPLMNVGSKYRIYSPYNLAYGERGAGGTIKPFSALIFEIELLGIE